MRARSRLVVLNDNASTSCDCAWYAWTTVLVLYIYVAGRARELVRLQLAVLYLCFRGGATRRPDRADRDRTRTGAGSTVAPTHRVVRAVCPECAQAPTEQAQWHTHTAESRHRNIDIYGNTRLQRPHDTGAITGTVPAVKMNEDIYTQYSIILGQ